MNLPEKLVYGFSRQKKRWAEKNIGRYKILVFNDNEKYVYYRNYVREVKSLEEYYKNRHFKKHFKCLAFKCFLYTKPGNNRQNW